MDNQRIFLFAILAVLILMLWSAWESEHRPATAPAAKQEVPAAPATPAAPGTPATPGKAAAPAPGAAGLETSERIQVSTDLLQVEIDTQGGDLRVVELRKHSVSLDQPGTPFRLLDDHGSRIFVAQSGLIGHEGVLPNHKSRYTAEASHYELAKGQDALTVRLNWSGPEGVRVTKTYTFHRNDYSVDIGYEISNTGRKPRDVYLYAQFLRSYEETSYGFTTLPTYTGGVIYTPEKHYEKINLEQMRDKPLAREAEGGWVAMLQHYFLGAWLPGAKDRNQYYSDAQTGNLLAIGYKTLTPTTVTAGGKATLSTRLFVGPKEQHRLEKLDETLKLTVDYGWLTFIAAPLFWILEWLHKLVGNWGWAIILLTILIKLVFYPLSVASYRSMAHMRKMQPRMAALKERFGDDRQKLNQAMMELYKTEKINPLGGCLPILVQIPVFIALYWVLLESVELRQAPFVLWLKDLSAPDPFFVLPVLMGASMLAQQWLNPQPIDPLQKKLMYALPVVFTGMFLFFPSGLVLYWVVQNILSVAQQWQINRAIEGKAK
jgi:YidC/Oxa1 family membrane protein insertase